LPGQFKIWIAQDRKALLQSFQRFQTPAAGHNSKKANSLTLVCKLQYG
jgi:hypothetical protein